MISHLSADGFAVLAMKKDLFQTIEVVCSRVNAYINNSNIVLKAGVCLLEEDDIYIVRHTFDMAKIACDTIKTDATRCWAVYTRDMGEALVNSLSYRCRSIYRAMISTSWTLLGWLKMSYPAMTCSGTISASK